MSAYAHAMVKLPIAHCRKIATCKTYTWSKPKCNDKRAVST